MILLEMLGSDPQTIGAAIEETHKAGLPVGVSMSCTDEDGSSEVALGIRRMASQPGRRRDEGTSIESTARIGKTGGDAFLVFHSQVEVTQTAVKDMRAYSDAPIGAYPHSGYWELPDWQFVNMISPEAYLAEANQWVGLGAQIIGGGGGIGLQHEELLRDGLSRRVSA